jgi:hypothetical protein
VVSIRGRKHPVHDVSLTREAGPRGNLEAGRAVDHNCDAGSARYSRATF